MTAAGEPLWRFEDIRFVAVIETSATQDYIFSSNRQAEIIGASHLVSQVTKTAFDSHAKNDHRLVPIVSASGLIVVGSDDRSALIEAIRHVTDTAWEKAPGLGVVGGIAGSGDAPSNADEAHELLRSSFRSVRQEQMSQASLASRFPVNPLAEICETGRGSAVSEVVSDGTPRFLGVAAKARRSARKAGIKQVTDLLPEGLDVARDMDAFDTPRGEDEMRWNAIVHADGDAIGTRLQNLIQVAEIENRTATEYWRTYSRFSQALERATVGAVNDAAESTIGAGDNDKTPFFPILIGGDDVTVIIPGELAIGFTAALVEGFTTRCEDDLTTHGLTMSAGILFKKPHYPFHAAYELASQLADSAKNVEGCSIDWHVLYDASPSTLTDLRAQQLVDGAPTTRVLTAKPLTLPDLEATRALASIIEPLSASMIHSLRTALTLPGNPAPLFDAAKARDSAVPAYADTLDEPTGARTRFLDSLELARMSS